MPVMDGYAAAQAIRALPAGARMPIIAMTANVMAGDREKAIAAGMCDHIAKPLSVGPMFATIARWVRRARRSTGGALQAVRRAVVIDEQMDLAGIDIHRGLSTAAQRPDLYRRLLLKFHAGQQGFAERFERARREAADHNAAERLAHTLKGTAASIGAVGVEAAAAALEAACRQQSDSATIDAALADVLNNMTPVMAGLSRLAAPLADAGAVPVLPASRVAATADAADLRPALSQLARMVARGDVDAVDLTEELCGRVKGAPEANVLKQVAEALAEYDFDAAAEALGTLGIHPST